MSLSKEIDKMKTRIRLIADAVTELHKRGEVNPYLLNDLDKIVLDEDLK